MLRQAPLVVCYHAVSDSWSHSLSVPPGMLERQLRQLLRLYRPASVEDVLSGRGNGLHVTFDDAFRSTANALPALRRLGLHATVFACSGLASNGDPLTVAALGDELASHPAELATMTWDELRGLTAEGVEIGSHTVSHPHLTQLDDGQLERELVESRQRIEAELGVRCRYLAYPFGEEDERVRAAARSAGYDAGFALRTERVGDPFSVARLGIWRDDRLVRAAAKVVLRRDRKRAGRWFGRTPAAETWM